MQEFWTPKKDLLENLRGRLTSVGGGDGVIKFGSDESELSFIVSTSTREMEL